MIKSYKYRIYPTEQQKILIKKTIGSCRWIYNWGLDQMIETYKKNGKSISRFELSKEITKLKKIEETKWLKDVYVHSLQNSLLKLENAYNFFFKKQNEHPRFKSRYSKKSFSFPSGLKVDFENKCCCIPKMGWVRTIFEREFIGKIKTTTVTLTPSDKYFISINVDGSIILPSKPQIKKDTTIGIDVGIKNFIILSDGRKFSNNKYLKNSQSRLSVLQRRLSKKVVGSKNRNKARIKVAKLYEKVHNQRLDNIHKITTQLIRENQSESFVVETLDVSGLMKNHKIAGAISDAGWTYFRQILEYKCNWYGKNFIKIGRFEPSSKMCSKCGYINQNLKLSDREWQCPECGIIHDRDINAAINIKNIGLSGEGISVEPVESSTLVEATKQEKLLVIKN